MKPAAGVYRLSTPGAPPMNFTVNPDGSGKSTLDDWGWNQEQDWFQAARHQAFIRCEGEGSFTAYVGVQPGFVVTGTCTKLS